MTKWQTIRIVFKQIIVVLNLDWFLKCESELNFLPHHTRVCI